MPPEIGKRSLNFCKGGSIPGRKDPSDVFQKQPSCPNVASNFEDCGQEVSITVCSRLIARNREIGARESGNDCIHFSTA
jgi:hypothetical protein